jgi:hypothetical protein
MDANISKVITPSKIAEKVLKAIKNGNVDRCRSALAIALAQKPPVDVNKVWSNGQTFLTFAGWFKIVLRYNTICCSYPQLAFDHRPASGRMLCECKPSQCVESNTSPSGFTVWH